MPLHPLRRTFHSSPQYSIFSLSNVFTGLKVCPQYRNQTELMKIIRQVNRQIKVAVMDRSCKQQEICLLVLVFLDDITMLNNPENP